MQLLLYETSCLANNQGKFCMQMCRVFQPGGKVALLGWVNFHSINMLLRKQPLEVGFEARTRGSTENSVLLLAT